MATALCEYPQGSQLHTRLLLPWLLKNSLNRPSEKVMYIPNQSAGPWGSTGAFTPLRISVNRSFRAEYPDSTNSEYSATQNWVWV